MTTVVPGVLAVPVCVLLAVAGLKLVQRLVPFPLRAAHNDVAGFIYAVVGVVYAVLLVFALITAREDYETANETMERETDELAEVYLLADRSPPRRIAARCHIPLVIAKLDYREYIM